MYSINIATKQQAKKNDTRIKLAHTVMSTS